MSNSTRREDVSHKLQLLEARVKALEDMSVNGGPQAQPPSTPVLRTGELPNSLSKSLQAMQSLGEADATTVSQKTGRNRSVETIYLNQLVRLGTLARRRVGKKVLFRLANVY